MKRTKEEKRIRLKAKIKSKMHGTSECPRLSVFRSNKFIYAQIINDDLGNTLAEANDAKVEKGTKVERAQEVGKMVAEACKKIGVEKVVFDRNGFKYTGRVKLVADAARSGGLKF
ncbi:MAG TPA: 50S ribosomal protein L18 [Candidatus Paceibacterota bacterium]|nr:50S ribosomal protein L18 [Candidatus Paceibacterota bacterium]